MSKNLKKTKVSFSEEEDEEDESLEDEEFEEEEKYENQGYVKDGFVVDDHISSDEENDAFPTKRKLAPLVKEEDSDFEFPKRPRRLKKEKDLNVDPSEKFEADSNFIEKIVRPLAPKLEGFGDEEDYDDQELEDEEEEEEGESKARIAEMLNEMGLDSGDREKVQEIVKTDWPERLQKRKVAEERKIPEAIHAEAIFIHEKMKKSFEYHSYNLDVVIQRIRNVLVNFHEKGFEAMFQFFYCRQDIFPEIKLQHLWEILKLDSLWQNIADLHSVVESWIERIFKLQTVPKGVLNIFYTSRDIRVLEIIKDYCIYHFSKLNPTLKLNENSEFKAPRNANFSNECLKVRLHEFSSMTAISPDQLAENLLSTNKERHMPPIQNISVETATESFVNNNHPFVSTAESTLRSLTKFMAKELFAQPELRFWIMEEYSKRVCVSTFPTEKGRKELDATHPFYPAKRINKRKKNYLIEDEELWCIIREAESAGLIKVRFVLPWDDEKRIDDSRDEIFSILKKKYLLSLSQYKQESEIQNQLTEEWNNLRIEILQVLLRDYMYKWMEKCTREDFDKRAESWILKKCNEAFRNLIFRAPFRKEKAFNDGSMAIEGEEQSTTVRVMGLVFDPERNCTAAAVVERNGEFLDSISFPEPIFKKESRENEGNSDSKALRELKDLLERHKPEVLIVSANCLKAKDFLYYLRKNLIVGNLSYNVYVEYGECELPILFAKSEEKELKNFSPLVKQAICLARFKQEPLVATLQLWKNNYKENPLLYLPLNHFQKQIPIQKLHDELERVAVECVNLVGVDINKVLALENHRNILQFVNGLGPHKAKFILEKIQSGVGMINSRADFFNILDQTVYDNISGFIRIKFDEDDKYLYSLDQKEKHVLDGTRIHPLDYTKAEKIARDTMDIHDRVKAINTVIGQKKRLAELELKDYAENLAAQKSQENQIHTLEFIRSELGSPFAEYRTEFKINDLALFYMLSRENPMYFRKGIYVTVKVFRALSDKLIVTCEPSGIKGQVKLHHEASYTEGQILRARLLKIGDNKVGYHDETRAVQVFDDHNNELILFSLEKEDLEFRRSRDLPILFKNWDSWKSTFVVEPTEDFPVSNPETTMKASTYVPRKINHPKFKNMTLNAALEYLADKPNGEFIIRPSSKGEDSLNITWKFLGNIIVHLNLKEGPKRPMEPIASKLYLNKDEFDSLDDIIHKYIVPCNQHLDSLIKHKKFIHGDKDYIQSELLQEKKLKPTTIPYFFGAYEKAPQFIVLEYMVNEKSGERIREEFIKVKPGGLFFHSTYFPSLNALITYFKENFQTTEYQRYLRKVKPPVQEEPSKAQELLNQIKEERIKDEKNVKKERKKHSSVICNICNRPGHVASECTNGNAYQNYERKDREHHRHHYRSRSRSRSNERKKRSHNDRYESRDYHSNHRDHRDNYEKKPRHRGDFTKKEEGYYNRGSHGKSDWLENTTKNEWGDAYSQNTWNQVPQETIGRKEMGWVSSNNEGWGDSNK